MNDAVTEVCSENLAFYGLVHDESDGAIRRIGPTVDLITQEQQVCLVVDFKVHGANRAPFVTSAIHVSLAETFITYADISLCVFHLPMKFGHCTHIVIVVPIVVVRVAIVHIDVPRTPLRALVFCNCLAPNSE